MELKNCYLCGTTVHPGQGFIKEGATFCSIRCEQQVSASSIRQNQRDAELGGCLGVIGNLIRQLVGLAVLGFIVLFIGVKACSSDEVPATSITAPDEGVDLDMLRAIEEERTPEFPSAELEPALVPEQAPVPMGETEEPPEVAPDTAAGPNLLELMETNQQQ